VDVRIEGLETRVPCIVRRLVHRPVGVEFATAETAMPISAVRSWVRQLDRRVGRLIGRRMVLVEVRTPVCLAVLSPIVRALLKDSRVTFRITGPDSPSVQMAVRNAGLADRWIDRGRASWMRVDLQVNADPWEAVALRRGHRKLNFFHGVAGKYDLDCPVGFRAGFETYTKLAFVNADRLKRYIDAGIISEDQAALVGYPKLDALVREEYDPVVERTRLGLDASRPTVLYGPTYSTASSLHIAGEAIIESLLASGFNVIVKLHDRSLEPSDRFTGGIDWRARLARFNSNFRFALAPGIDASPYLAAADALVTDHSSIGFEFLVLDRPLIVYVAPDLTRVARISSDKVTLLRNAADLVASPAALVNAVRAALAAPQQRSRARQDVAELMFHQPGTATFRAMQLIYELLELTPAPNALSEGTSLEDVEGPRRVQPAQATGS
jgi:hypothetical protein